MNNIYSLNGFEWNSVSWLGPKLSFLIESFVVSFFLLVTGVVSYGRTFLCSGNITVWDCVT